MHRSRRPAVMLLLLLTVTFGPLLCRSGGAQAQAVGLVTPAVSEATAAALAPGGTTAAAPDVATTPDVAAAPKRCSDRHAPGPQESAPLPAPHRAEPLAPATTGAGPLSVDLPAQFALARPPTDGSSATDHTALLPVLRI
ncbi:hypothetical protein [Streptomyces sp. NPDC020742]|uniref:hypothetical protein n=1 Tax=Streptomyces sp. NPDC020742 TaxID=3154897 RepID=UPI0033C8635A